MSRLSKDQSIPVFTSPSLAACSLIPLCQQGLRLQCTWGCMRQQNSSCFYPGTCFFGLQGMEVNKERKTKSSVCFPLPSHGNQELRPSQGEVAGTRGRHSANRLEKLGKLRDSGSSQDWEEPLGQREVPTLLFSSLCVIFSQAMKPLPM